MYAARTINGRPPQTAGSGEAGRGKEGATPRRSDTPPLSRKAGAGPGERLAIHEGQIHGFPLLAFASPPRTSEQGCISLKSPSPSSPPPQPPRRSPPRAGWPPTRTRAAGLPSGRSPRARRRSSPGSSCSQRRSSPGQSRCTSSHSQSYPSSTRSTSQSRRCRRRLPLSRLACTQPPRRPPNPPQRPPPRSARAPPSA